MSDLEQNLETIEAGGSNDFDVTWLNKPKENGGVPTNPTGYVPPANPAPYVTVVVKIYNRSTQVFSAPSGGYVPPTVASLRYAGSTGSFLITGSAPSNVTQSANLAANEFWALEWYTTINGFPVYHHELFTVLAAGASQSSTALAYYSLLNDVRKEVNQLQKREVYTISASGQATVALILLPDNNTVGIYQIKKNNVPLSSGAFVFKGPNRIEFSPSLTLGDILEVTRNLFLSDDEVIKQAFDIYNHINNVLAVTYTVPFDLAPDEPPHVGTVSDKLTAAAIRKLMFDSVQRDGDRRGDEQWTYWNQQLLLIRTTEGGDLLDKNGKLITHKKESFGILVSTEDEQPIFTLEDPRDIKTLERDTGYPHDYLGRKQRGDA